MDAIIRKADNTTSSSTLNLTGRIFDSHTQEFTEADKYMTYSASQPKLKNLQNYLTAQSPIKGQ